MVRCVPVRSFVRSFVRSYSWFGGVFEERKVAPAAGGQGHGVTPFPCVFFFFFVTDIF